MFCRCIQFYRCRCKKEQEFQNKLEMYKILYQAYADEIKNLWQRSAFLGVFMTLAWGGYGALQLKTLDKEFEVCLSYCLMSIGLCIVIIILSLLWIAMAKGSKFVQEAHERHIQRYIKKHKCRIFCDLNTYERILNKKLCGDLFFCGTLKAYRYSPSKINIALGWLSLLVSGCLAIYHIHSFWDNIKAQIPFLENVLDIIMRIDFSFNHFIILVVLGFILFVFFIIYLTLKGNSQSFLCRFLSRMKDKFQQWRNKSKNSNEKTNSTQGDTNKN